MLFCIWHYLDKNSIDVPKVEFWFFLTPYFPELLKIRAIIWFPLVSQTLSLTGLGPHSGKYGQPFSNLFKKYIYISPNKKHLLWKQISTCSQAILLSCMLWQYWMMLCFFFYSLYRYSFAFPFHFSFVFCPFLYVWKSLLCL